MKLGKAEARAGQPAPDAGVGNQTCDLPCSQPCFTLDGSLAPSLFIHSANIVESIIVSGIRGPMKKPQNYIGCKIISRSVFGKP